MNGDDVWIRPQAAARLIPGMTEGNLSQMRHRGKGPKFYKPSPGVVLYRRTDVLEWAEERSHV